MSQAGKSSDAYVSAGSLASYKSLVVYVWEVIRIIREAPKKMQL